MSNTVSNHKAIELFKNAIGLQEAIIAKAEYSIDGYKSAINKIEEIINKELNNLEVING